MSTATLSQAKPAIATIWRQGLIAAGVAAVINAILYGLGSAMGAFPAAVLTPMGTPITLAPVVIMSIALLLVGTLVYILLSRWTANPNRWFTLLSILLLLVMAYNPFTLPGAPMLMILLLQLMHLVAGGSILYFLTRTR